MRKAAVIALLFFLFIAIAGLFWRNEWIYSLPTPVPRGYRAVQPGEQIRLTSAFQHEEKPVFLHFFNPDCPCSKFNIPHFRALAKKYGGQVKFAIVVMTENREYTEENIQDKFHIRLPVFFDSTLAVSCGVYSTPQAVIINSNHTLFFRGNYNKSRYCTDKKSNYAEIALDSLVNHKNQPLFNHFALQAYGCVLPTCRK